MHVVAILSRLTENLEKVLWTVAKWIFHYVQMIMQSYIIKSQGHCKVMLMLINFANYFDERRFTTEFVFQRKNGPISQISKLQSNIDFVNHEV